MKKALNLALTLLAFVTIELRAQTSFSVPSQANVSAQTYHVVQQDANSRVWQRETYDQGPDGQVVTNLHSYSEIASGLNFLDSSGAWQASKEEIDLQPDGTAQAVQGQHQAYFPANIFGGEIELITPDHKTLKSQPAALSYDDGTNTVLIAVLTNSVGQVINGNQVIYTNAFTGLDADLIYTYTRAGFEQDIVLREQPPTPESLGLNAATTRLQVLTEFFNPPHPCETACTLPEQAGLALGDETLDFGLMQMAPGKAFKVEANSPSARVGKSWITLDGRQFLVEAVPVMALAGELESLPTTSAQTAALIKTRMFSRNPVLPPPHLAKADGHQLKLAKNATIRQRGVVLDYNILNTSLTNFTFQGDTTYYLSGNVNLYGTNTFEGGSVIKYANGVSISTSSGSQLNWQAGAYRPVIFTAKDDNSVGQTISGSTGSPSGYYALNALNLTETTNPISNFRISYAQQAIQSYGYGNTFYNGQIINCQNGVENYSDTVLLRNLLFVNVKTNLNVIFNGTIDAQNVTFSGSAYLAPDVAFGSLSLRNCILANVTNLTNIVSSATIVGTNNGFYNTFEFGINAITNNFYPFQTVGAGSYYLTNGCSFINGTTSLDPVWLAQLANKTTHPPLVYSNQLISTNLVLGPIIPRDTNAAPDLGYHYDPLDYAFGGCDVSTNLTFTPGTAVGWFYSNDHLSGIACAMLLNNGANLTFNGTATSPCWVARFATVQEGNSVWALSSSQPGIELNGSGTGATPQLNAQFSKWSVLGSDAGHFKDNNALGKVNIANSEFYLENIVTYKMSSICFTNCLFYRAALFFYDSAAAPVLTMENCTLYNGILVGSRTSGQNQFWTIENTVFDGTGFRFTDYYNGSYTLFNYNAYNTNNLSGLTIPFPYGATTNFLEVIGANDLMVTNFNWKTSWFGNFYLPTNSPLINKGSTTANLLGLYHFTTQTNQVPETNSVVDIAYHYVATDTSGVPLDVNEDGIPDYIEDANGNGLADNGETNWAIAITSQPANVTTTVGNNVSFSVSAIGISPVYAWYFDGSLLAGKTSTTLTINDVTASEAGSYTVVVSDASGSVTSSPAELTIDIYVAQTTTGSGSGDDVDDCKSLAWLNSYTESPGISINLVGTITNYLVVNGSGSAGSPVTIYFELGANMTAGSWPALSGDGGGAINLVNNNYITIDGGENGLIQATNAGTLLGSQVPGTGVSANGAANLVVKNLTIANMYVRSGTGEDGGGTGVRSFWNGGPVPHDIIVSNCVIHDVYGGVNFDYGPGASNLVMTACTAYNCNMGGFADDHSASSTLTNLVVSYNHFYSWSNWNETSNNYNHHNGFYAWCQSGGGTDNYLDGFYCYGNTVGPGFNNALNNQTSGIYASGNVNYVHIFNNLFIANSGDSWADGLIFLWPGIGTPIDLQVFNNTMVSASGGVGISLFAGVCTYNIKNNLMVGVATGISQYEDTSATLISDYNVYYNSNYPVQLQQTSNDSGNYATLATWQSWGYDTHSTAANPNLDASYVPQPTSSAIDAGTNLTSENIIGLDTDAVGNSRPISGNWDIGWQEYVPGGGDPVYESTCITPAGGNNYGSGTTFTATFNEAVAVGKTVAIGYGGYGISPSSVTDTRGNTWTLQSSSAGNCYVYSTTVTTAIQSGDSLVVTYSSGNYYNQFICGAVLDNVTGVDVTASNSGSQIGGVVSATATTTQANDVIFSVVQAYSCDYAGGNFTSIGAETGAEPCGYFAYDVLSAAGGQNPGGSVGSYNIWAATWVAFK